MNHLHPRRDFNPKKSARYGRPTFSPAKLVKFSPKWGYSRLFNFPFRGSHWRPRMHTVVIAVDGASKTNNRASSMTKASFGVFVGPQSGYNSWGLLNSKEQTNSRAELEAVKQALTTIQTMDENSMFPAFSLREIIIKTDSEYVHNTFNVWIWNYVKNGYRLGNGKPAAHADLIDEIHDMICRMEDQLCMAVRFWKVGREWNTDADELANRAFRGESADSGYSED